MTATVTPIHARRAGHAVSEGTASARRINRPGQCASLTPEPLLLHRVDASQLQTPVRIVNGPVEQRQCRPGMCEGLHTCGDHACQGHPGTATRAVRPADEPSPPERVPGKASRLSNLLVVMDWLVILLVCALLAAAQVVMGPPHDH